MYAKVFAQIFDSSIADDFRLRHFFMDMLVLADVNGVVDMTPTAIAARTRIPLKDVSVMLATLEQPDPESRTPDHDGRRIAKLDEHRTWGWCILNYDKFRSLASEEQRREKTRIRTEKWRKKRSVTHCDAGDAMQRQMQTQKKGEMPPPISNGELSDTKRVSLETERREKRERMASLKGNFMNDSEKAEYRELRDRVARIDKTLFIPL